MTEEDMQELARSGQWDTLLRLLETLTNEHQERAKEALELLLAAADRGTPDLSREESPSRIRSPHSGHGGHGDR